MSEVRATFDGGPVHGKEFSLDRSFGRIHVPTMVCSEGDGCDCHKPAAADYDLTEQPAITADGVGVRYLLVYAGTPCGVCPPDCERNR